jgi:hypothetical protein
MVPDRRLLCLAIVAAVAFTLVRAHAGSGGAPPPPLLSCTTDADCPGCDVCRNRQCIPPVDGWRGCFCDAECAAVGKLSCDLSAGKPLCGGECSAAAPATPRTCGSGDDVVRLEAFGGLAREAPGGAVPGRETVVVETGVRR